MYKKCSFILASVFGAGYFPKAPGTMGSLVTLPLVWLCWQWNGLTGIIALALTAFVLGCIATKEVLKHTKHDPSLVVIDEVAGQSLAFIFVAPYMNLWWVYLAGFLFFRFFDIFKVGPVKWADEKVKNQYGVMLDDVFAGVFAAVDLWILVKLVEWLSA
jgi:phosphatidylglycerophosphatase A